MEVNNHTVFEFISSLKSHFDKNDFSRNYFKEKDAPLRAELFNADQLEQQGKASAKSHKVSIRPGKDWLLKRLQSNERTLLKVHGLLTKAIKDNKLIAPAGEWLLDNFYLIEEQIRIGKKHFPMGYSETLPQLINGSSAGLPRVYDIALEIISHSDGRVDMEGLTRFIKAYQTVTHLQIGELWAIPIMLRLVLIENLRRVSVSVAVDRLNQNIADDWAQKLVETSEKDPKNLILVIADMVRSGPPMESSFVAELIRQLLWKGSALALPLTWMEQRLSENGLNSNQLVQMENQKQAADQVSISNSIGSLRFLNNMQWHEFIESLSVVEMTLRNDPAGIYPKMDFDTRDQYRHVIERIARKSKLPENAIASIALQLSQENALKNNSTERGNHIGYYLVGKGLEETERRAKINTSIGAKVKNGLRRHRLLVYAGSIVFATLFLTALLLDFIYDQGLGLKWLVPTGVLLLIAASHLSISIVNWLSTLFISPRSIPRMDFSSSIPTEFSTIVVVPTMLTDEAEVSDLVESLEIRFLANRDENLYFALLTDFLDAKEEHMPGDEQLVKCAEEKITVLNQKYGRNKDIFYLFHRPRKWNRSDNVWMGYERKRGKLTELNSLLRNGTEENFSLIVGDLAILKNVKYVITLDSDTQLPQNAARKLVGTMAHPLNHPVLDDKKLIVTEGYGILQPRVAVNLPLTNSSLYTRMHSKDAGIDPYTRFVSDVYQDIFNEGSFIGKGIYDIETFEKTLNNRFPENRILSHDLLEGCYTRSGLVTDVQLYEDYPSRYGADVKRRHRWIRGDWQIAWWFLPWVPGIDRHFHSNPLSALSRWKIFDNIRRSLVPFAVTTLLLLGWTIIAAHSIWTLLVSAIVILPALISSTWKVFNKSADVKFEQHLLSVLRSIKEDFVQNLFVLICIPYEAYFSLEAILTTSWRMLISRKKLLEWNRSSSKEHRIHNDVLTEYKTMWVAPFIAIFTVVYLSLMSPVSLPVSAAILLLWMASPLIAWWISKPFIIDEVKLSERQVAFLRKTSRKTWAFFEQFVGPEDNWLPPDNYQEDPAVVAHRTSPTNIGLSVLANLSAYDFGYITVRSLVERTQNTFNTLRSLERMHGHFFNWYDTVTLNPMLPRYISTVDSGNLAGHLITLRQGLLSLANKPISGPILFEGLRDTLRIIKDNSGNTDLLQKSKMDIDFVRYSQAPLGSGTEKKYLEDLVVLADDMLEGTDKNNIEAIWWIETLKRQTQNALDNLNYFIPWLSLADIEKFNAIILLPQDIALGKLPEYEEQMLLKLSEQKENANTEDEETWLVTVEERIRLGQARAREALATISELADQCYGFADMEYDFLYDKAKHLLTIGYNVDDHRKDTGCYDLLASEVRLCIFVAIAQGKLPQESWFALGRLLISVGKSSTLLSWSGSMFEYLMPALVMPVYENTLLYQTNKTAVKRQIEYGRQHGVAWGISESGYNMVDASLNYQYRAFGVPGLGLKRGLAEDLVIAPYATMLALMAEPIEACQNLEALAAEKFEGRFGFYEAIDYTPARLARGQSSALIKSYMVHHQGMGLLAIENLLLGKQMQKYFEAEPQFQAVMLLLQERIPDTTAFYSHTSEIAEVSSSIDGAQIRIIKTPDTPIPEVQLLSNGKYHVMVTNSGAGYSRWKDIAVTRWREDGTSDNWGTFCYVRDLEERSMWSITHQPTLKKSKSYEAVFTQGRAEFRRRDNNIEMHTEISISPEDDIEIRRIHITNHSSRYRTIDITSYAEVVLNSQAADEIHPAFSNLFVQTEILNSRNAILCTRRPRSPEDSTPWMFHMMSVSNASAGSVSYETDRMKFVGHGNSIVNPKAMTEYKPLSNSQGFVLDPIVAIRYQITLEPNDTCIIDMLSGIGDTKESCIALVEKYQDKHNKDRVFELGWTHSQVILRQLNASEADAQLYNHLAGSIIYNNPLLRADPSVLVKNNKGQSGLWPYSISGDLPIVLLLIGDQDNIELVKQLIQAHAYWRLKGLIVDLVIWNEDNGGYRQNLQNQILGLISAGVVADVTDKPGGIFIRAADQISLEDRILIQTVARVIIDDKKGSFEDQLNRRNIVRSVAPYLVPNKTFTLPLHNYPEQQLDFFNGLGGFSPDGKEYVINTANKKYTPAPWCNVLANPNFGTIISENGQAYTWATNAQKYRLSPWMNDPVTDSSGEAIYLRDEDSGYFWSPAPLPVRSDSAYITRHGFGYTVFEHIEDGIESQMTVFVDIEKSIKFSILKVRNNSQATRKLSATGYVELILGDSKHKSSMHVVTETDPETNALFARNTYNSEFEKYTTFFDVDDVNKTVTGDRTEFIGRNRDLRSPEALMRTRLSGRLGAAMDPCAAIQVAFTLTEGLERTIIFKLGIGNDVNEARSLVREYYGLDPIFKSLERVKAYWQHTLTSIQIDTPDAALNVMTNGWLLYQVLSSRIWARSGYYQSSGAYGFRDQLQDVMAVIHSQPSLTRSQILLSASRQFKEGDVQHWWHPPMGQGVRTKCSDDLLWLPFVTCYYISSTGDKGILDESIGFIENRLLGPDETSIYEMPLSSNKMAKLYEHCVLAIIHALKFGEHGLPLIGSGDWNDGMDRVGIHGKGESVWLAFFLYYILDHFGGIAGMVGDTEFANKCKNEMDQLKINIEKNAWDGEWYKRAYFDNGDPLGSAKNTECKIDSIPQSWSVISGAGEVTHARRAMEEAYKQLVKKDSELIQLFSPAFDKSPVDPGYIRGYVPGVRENGGQYTHAAIWLIMAFAKLGDRKKVEELLKMVNPVNHGSTPEQVAIYNVEPYVIAADVYTVSQHTGKGGWTWYTGSAGWYYRLVIEYVLGFRLEVGKLHFSPCIPESWTTFKLKYRYKSTLYSIVIIQEDEATQSSITIDGKLSNDRFISLIDDQAEHNVEIVIGAENE